MFMKDQEAKQQIHRATTISEMNRSQSAPSLPKPMMQTHKPDCEPCVSRAQKAIWEKLRNGAANLLIKKNIKQNNNYHENFFKLNARRQVELREESKKRRAGDIIQKLRLAMQEKVDKVLSKQFCDKMKRGSVLTTDQLQRLRPELKSKWFKTVINHDNKNDSKTAIVKSRLNCGLSKMTQVRSQLETNVN